jgi:hypothetical protein
MPFPLKRALHTKWRAPDYSPLQSPHFQVITAKFYEIVVRMIENRAGCQFEDHGKNTLEQRLTHAQAKLENG